MLVTPTLEVRTRSPSPAIACARVVDRHRSEDYARGRSDNQFKFTHSLQVHRADNESMHLSKCVFVPVVAFGIIPPPLRHPCPVMLGVPQLIKTSRYVIRGERCARFRMVTGALE